MTRSNKLTINLETVCLLHFRTSNDVIDCMFLVETKVYRLYSTNHVGLHSLAIF